MSETNCCTDTQPVKPDMCCGSNMEPFCGCIGYGYVPVQELNELYDVDSALMRGSMFPELDITIEEYGKICKMRGGVMND
ncbi:MAG: spore coat associated protein CotJA [Candidatus Ornithomonoglobus sp.]